MDEPSIEDVLVACDGILNMHERAAKAGVLCKLNGQSREFNMGEVDCGTAACLMGSASLHPWFKEREVSFNIYTWYGNSELRDDFDSMVMRPEAYGISGGIKEMSAITIPEVRAKLHAIILKYCGKQALTRCKRNKKLGDKLRIGVK